MVPQPETRILEAADLENAPTGVHQNRAPKRSAALHNLSSREMLKDAQKLLLQVLSILEDPICENHPSSAWSFRLARAHALTLLDHLARMSESP